MVGNMQTYETSYHEKKFKGLALNSKLKVLMYTDSEFSMTLLQTLLNVQETFLKEKFG